MRDNFRKPPKNAVYPTSLVARTPTGNTTRTSELADSRRSQTSRKPIRVHVRLYGEWQGWIRNEQQNPNQRREITKATPHPSLHTNTKTDNKSSHRKPSTRRRTATTEWWKQETTTTVPPQQANQPPKKLEREDAHGSTRGVLAGSEECAEVPRSRCTKRRRGADSIVVGAIEWCGYRHFICATAR